MSSLEDRFVATRRWAGLVPTHYAYSCVDCGLAGATGVGERCASCAAEVLAGMTAEEILALMPVAALPKDAA